MSDIPATWRATQTVNLITAGAQSRPRITQLTNGNLVVVWVTSDAGGTSFVARLFDPAGNPISGELFRQYVTPDDNYTFPDVVAGLNGVFVTSYMSGNGTAIFRNTWNANGDPVGNGSAFESVGPGQPAFANPTMAWSNTNRVLAVYELLSPTGSTIVGQITTPGTAGSGTRLTLLDFAGGVVDPAVAANRLNGNFMIVGTNMQAGDSQIVLRLINATTGATISGPFAVNGTGSNGRTDDQPSVSQAGNGFILAFRSTSGGDSNIEFRLLGGDGSVNFAGSISAGAGDKFANPTVVPLPDFSFMIIYDDEVTHTQRAAHYYGPGTLFPGTLIGTYAYAPTGSDTDAVALMDGRFASVWTDAATGEISLQILDPRDAPNAAGADGVVAGTVGNDVIAGGTGRIFGGLGNDDITLRLDRDLRPSADGGAGTDTFVLSNPQGYATYVNLAAGTVGFGYLSGQTHIGVTLSATNFENFRYSGNANMEVWGTSGANVIAGGSGDENMLFGLGGDDIFSFEGGFDEYDRVDGGEGYDQIVLHGLYMGRSRLGLSANTITGIEAIVLLPAFEYVGYELSTHNANVAAGAVLKVDASQLAAGQNFDFNGSAELDGSFLVLGGGGYENLYGGAGNDTLNGGGGGDALNGLGGNDTLDGGTGADAMTGGGGSDTFIVDNAGDTVIEGVAGIVDTDTVNAYVSWTMAAGQEIERLRAGPGTDPINLTGNEFGQKLVGNNGANTLTGGGGNDNIQGGSGADTLIGGSGLDKLTGGDGADIFVMQIGGQLDRIVDFAAGTDKMDLRAFGMTFQQVLAATTESGGTATINLGNGDLIQLVGVTKASLSSGDFLLAGSSGGSAWIDTLEGELWDGDAAQIAASGPHFLATPLDGDMWHGGADWYAM